MSLIVKGFNGTTGGLVAGHFVAQYGGVDIGSTREGYELQESPHHQPVIDDAGGESEVSGVQQGIDYLLTGVYIEYEKMKTALYRQVPRGKLYDNVGLFLPDLADVLALTPIIGTSAYNDAVANGGINIIFPVAIVVNNINTLLKSKLREAPITFRIYPGEVDGEDVVYYFSDTIPASA